MATVTRTNQPPLESLTNQPPRESPLAAHKPSPWFNVLAVVVVAGMIYSGYHLVDDLSVVRDARAYPYVWLGIALLIALSFEFVNGFHDTADAVATVIYTNSLSTKKLPAKARNNGSHRLCRRPCAIFRWRGF